MVQRPNISVSFNDRGEPRQVMKLDELYDTSEETRDKLAVLIANVMGDADVDEGFVGPNKKKEDAVKKVDHRFDGDARYLTDVVRGKVIIDNVDQLETIIGIFKDPESDILKDAGVEVVQEKNNFETPKDYTGYRGLSYKLAIPTGDDNKPHIVELQIVSKAMEMGNDTTFILDKTIDPENDEAANDARMSIYDGTHYHKRMAENLYRNAARDYKAGTREDPSLTDEELETATKHYAVCVYYNSKIAHEEGYDRFLIDKEKHAFNSDKEKELVAHMADIGVEP